jgi:type I restriction enzyme, S subunit
MTWPSLPFSETIRKTRVGRRNQIPASEIKPTGRFPVVDQGQAFIAGYSDDEKRVIKDELPLVVFGDHTRVIKFVDFPFILGADGTKVLKPREDKFDPRFFALALESLKLPSRGYNRHFALLKERRVVQPELPEQRKIAGVLGLVQLVIEQQERLRVLAAELKKTLLHRLFTYGVRHESQKQTELGPLPQSWEVVKLENVCTFLSGGTPSKKRPEFWFGSIPWVSPKDMKKPRLRDVADHISQAALDEGSALAPAGSVLVVIRGMILARDVPVALAEVPMAFNQDTKAIIPGERIESEFLLYALEAFKKNLFQKVGRSAHGTVTLMSSDIAQFSIPLPDKWTQKEIAGAMISLERSAELHSRKHAALSTLFRTLLHELMTARIRVHDLDLPKLETVAAK